MAVEIERKFLVRDPNWMALDHDGGQLYAQGYLCSDADRTVRVRVTPKGAWLTIKGRTVDVSRSEYEYEIPTVDALEMLERLCPNILKKTRYRLAQGKHTWEIDVFDPPNEPLIVAEIELSSPDEEFERPDWLGEEVSQDRRYGNSRLAQSPYSTWS